MAKGADLNGQSCLQRLFLSYLNSHSLEKSRTHYLSNRSRYSFTRLSCWLPIYTSKVQELMKVAAQRSGNVAGTNKIAAGQKTGGEFPQQQI